VRKTPLGGFRPTTMSNPLKIDVSILIVSYNTRDMTLAALDSIAAETLGLTYEIIVVDNASTDGSAAAIAAHPAKPKLITLQENIGFGRANNLAAENARGYYILLLNPDTLILDNAIGKLVAFAQENRRAMIWGGRTVFADGTLNPSSCWRRMTPWNLFCRFSGLSSLFPASEFFNGEAYGAWQRDRVRHVDIVSGCFLLIPRSIWLALGGFDPLYFMYGEEADLCLRARRLGAHPLLTPEATIIHFGGASERARAAKMVKLIAAKMTLIKRHWNALLRPLGRLLLAAWPLTRALGFKLAARLTGKPHLTEAAGIWREVWLRRSEWWNGYHRRPTIEEEDLAAVPLLSRLGTHA